MRVDETDAAAALHSLQAKPPLSQLTRSFHYFLRIHELFARSYAQWVAIRSSDETLLDQVSQSLSTLHYPEYWGFDDFDPVADALDRIFMELTWKL
jgi:hypothetical protein